MLVGQFSLEDLGTWPFMVKGHPHQIFLDSGTLASEKVLVFRLGLCPGSLLLGDRERDQGSRLGFRIPLEVKALSSARALVA